jgi:hypothetical protein
MSYRTSFLDGITEYTSQYLDAKAKDLLASLEDRIREIVQEEVLDMFGPDVSKNIGVKAEPAIEIGVEPGQKSSGLTFDEAFMWVCENGGQLSRDADDLWVSVSISSNRLTLISDSFAVASFTWIRSTSNNHGWTWRIRK